jgi:hypothetical protein
MTVADQAVHPVMTVAEQANHQAMMAVHTTKNQKTEVDEMNFVQFIGFILIIGAAYGLYHIFLKGRKKMSLRDKPREAKNNIEILPSDTETKPDKKLKAACSGQTVTLLGEKERQIIASVSLYEMTQNFKDAPWSRTGLISKCLILSGGIYIFKMPSQESGKPIWLKAEEIETLTLLQFYLGESKENPGPARLFNQKKQTVPIPYELPNELTPGVIWEVIDIGTLNVEIDGESDIFIQGDRQYFTTSREKDGKRRLLFLDARRPEAKGTGGLFLCEQFEPSVEIMDIL